MALQTFKGGVWIPQIEHYVHRTGDFLIDAAGEKFAVIFKVPKTGTISKIGFMTGAVANSQTLRVGLQTVDPATGDASGTAYGGMTVGTQAAPAADTWYTVTLGTGASATVGDYVAAVIEFDATVGSVYFRVTNNTNDIFPYCGLYTTVWTKSVRVPLLGIEYSDGSYEFNNCLAYNTNVGAYTINTGTTPDEVGNYFSFPSPVTVSGVWVAVDLDGDGDIILYDNADTVLATTSLDKEMRGSTVRGNQYYSFASVTLTKDTIYRLVIKPTTTTSLSIYYSGFPTVAAMDTFPYGQLMYQTTRTDAGAWTEDTTQRVMIAPLIIAFSDGVGGSGGGMPILRGSVVGG